MKKAIRNWLARRMLSFVMWHLRKQRVCAMGEHGPNRYGRIIHGEIKKDPEGHPIDLTLTWTCTGKTGATYRDFSFRSLKRDEDIGWTFPEASTQPLQSS